LQRFPIEEITMNHVSSLVTALIVLMSVTLLQPAARAGEMGARSLGSTSTLSADRAAIDSTLDRADVEQKLLENGVSVEQARERLSRMSPSEIHEVARQAEKAQAGGDALGFVVVILVIVLLVILIVYLVNRV
jgi:hypothetical protein